MRGELLEFRMRAANIAKLRCPEFGQIGLEGSQLRPAAKDKGLPT
jgi:hypothetical protein